jgi:hypothetical protein
MQGIGVPPARRFDDRIRELCTKALSAKEPDELALTLSELQWAIHQRIVRLRKLAAAAFTGQSAFPKERRKARAK